MFNQNNETAHPRLDSSMAGHQPLDYGNVEFFSEVLVVIEMYICTPSVAIYSNLGWVSILDLRI